MEALINYKGQQILLTEGEKVKIPYQKDLKPGSSMEFNEVLYFFDGKKRKIGNPYLKSFSVKGKVDSHFKDSKVVVFKKKRRKGHQKKNGHRQPYTLLQINKLQAKKTTAKKATVKTKRATTTKKTSVKKTAKKTAKKTTKK